MDHLWIKGIRHPPFFMGRADYMYGVIGRLAMLAASYELEATDPDAEVYD